MSRASVAHSSFLQPFINQIFMSGTTNIKSHTRPFMGTKLQPRQGVPAGLFAGLGMLILWLIGAQVWGPGAETLLSSIGGVLLPGGSPVVQMAMGLVIHFVISIGLGALFAVSLDRLSAKDTLIVSTFYGFTIWVVSILILRHWVHVDAVQMSRSWWGFFVFLAFGFLLGVYANRFGQAPADA
jgi:hypothetical protein